MALSNFHAARIVDPASIKKDSFNDVKDVFAPGVDVTYGIAEGKDAREVQVIRFDKTKFTEASARKWLKDHDFKAISFEPAQDAPAQHAKLETVDMPNEQVFAIGKWTDSSGAAHTYSEEDLIGMAKAANESNYKPAIKLGHNEEQTALKEAFGDGAAAAGWMRNFRVEAGKLIADLTGVPKKLSDLIKAGAYKCKSLEISSDFKDEGLGKTFKLMPVGLALLGAKMPALSNLNDLTAIYKTEGSPATSFYFSFDETYQSNSLNLKGGDNMTPEEIKEMQEENSDMKSKLAKLEADCAKHEKDAEAIKAEHAKAIEDAKAELDKSNHGKSEIPESVQKLIDSQAKQISDLSAQFSKNEDEKFAAFLEANSTKLTPDMAAAFGEQYKLAKETPTCFKFSKGEGAAKVEFTGAEAIKQRIAALPINPLLKEYGKSDDPKAAGEGFEKKIAAYCAENKLDISNHLDYAKAIAATGALKQEGGE